MVVLCRVYGNAVDMLKNVVSEEKAKKKMVEVARVESSRKLLSACAAE